jgi:CRP-like cAMP-binding protein
MLLPLVHPFNYPNNFLILITHQIPSFRLQKDYTILLSSVLNAYTPVGREASDLLFENGNAEEYRKDEIIFHQNRFNAFEYFQLDGISHRFNVDSDKHSLTTGIFQNETVITPHFARTKNNQSIYSLQALTECTFLKVPAGTFNDLREQNAQIRAFAQAVVEREFARSLNFEVLFRSYTAKERLLFFRANYPQLENRIPHTVIASFLGITPVSFSRLRGELTKE